MNSYAIGTNVCSSGAVSYSRTGGLTCGYIEKTNQRFAYYSPGIGPNVPPHLDQVLANAVQANYSSCAGDSGAPVGSGSAFEGLEIGGVSNFQYQNSALGTFDCASSTSFFTPATRFGDVGGVAPVFR